jgi:hypothetical protein
MLLGNLSVGIFDLVMRDSKKVFLKKYLMGRSSGQSLSKYQW